MTPNYRVRPFLTTKPPPTNAYQLRLAIRRHCRTRNYKRLAFLYPSAVEHGLSEDAEQIRTVLIKAGWTQRASQ